MTGETPAAGFGLGCVKLGSAGSGGPRTGGRVVRHALDRGVTFFDTADAYGDGTSERVLGLALRSDRDRVRIATKAGYRFRERSATERIVRRLAAPVLAARNGRGATPVATPDPSSAAPSAAPSRGSYAERDFSPRYLRTALEGSLRRLGTDRVDLLQLHGPADVCGDDVVALMADLRQEGKIRGFGVGLEALDRALAWLEIDGLASIQLPFGILDPEAGDRIIPAAAARGVHVVVRGVFAAGLLADIAPGAEALLRPQQRELRREIRALATANGFPVLALAAWFARSRSGVGTVLLGSSSTEHLDENLGHFACGAPERPVVDALEAALARYVAACCAPVLTKEPS